MWEGEGARPRRIVTDNEPNIRKKMSQKAKIEKLFANLRKQVSTLPKVVGNSTVNFALDNFRKEGFQGETFQPWQKRKKKAKGAAQRKILIQSGRLRRSVRITSVTPHSVWVGSDVPYARIHNEGGTINRAARSETFVRNRYKRGKKAKAFGGKGLYKKGTTAGRGQTYKAYSIQMPRRQFLGDSPVLRRMIHADAVAHLKKALTF